MSWKDELGHVEFPGIWGPDGRKPALIGASFRGVAFFVESAERGGGRRTVRHEYPLRDEPFVEDLGRQARSFQVDGYVIGDSYLEARNALIAALEEAGPGELVHPYHGTLRVICSGYRVRESSAEGGMARFSLAFDETAASPVLPVAVPDAAARVAASAVQARKAAGQEFQARFSPGTLMNGVADALRSATLRINNVLSTVSMTTQELASLKRRLDGLVSAANTLVNLPGNLLGELESLFGSLPGALALEVYSFDAGLRPPATTATRRQERKNLEALHELVQRLAVIRAAASAPAETYESHDTALAAREAVTSKLDEQLETAGDETYPALLQLRADLVRAIPGEDAALPRLLKHTPPRTVPSLVLAHRLYGDVRLEADLLARNRVRHPGFILGGHELEVLSRG